MAQHSHSLYQQAGYPQDGPRPLGRDRWLWGAAAFLALAAVLALLSVEYLGLARPLGEMQFAVLGAYFPGLTVVMIVALALAGAALMRAVFLRVSRPAGSGGVIVSPPSQPSPRERAAHTALTLHRWRSLFALLAIACAIGAVYALSARSGVPQIRQPYLPIDGNGPAGRNGAHARAVPAELREPVRLGTVVRLSERVALLSRDRLFAPVLPDGEPTASAVSAAVMAMPVPAGQPGPAAGGAPLAGAASPSPAGAPAQPPVHLPVRLLVTMLPDAVGAGAHPVRRGLLVHDGAPPAVLALYRQQGMAFADNVDLLVPGREQAIWDYEVIGVNLALLSALALVVSLLFGHFRRRFHRATADILARGGE